MKSICLQKVLASTALPTLLETLCHIPVTWSARCHHHPAVSSFFCSERGKRLFLPEYQTVAAVLCCILPQLFFVFLWRHHSDQMSEGPQVSEVTLYVQIMKCQSVRAAKNCVARHSITSPNYPQTLLAPQSDAFRRVGYRNFHNLQDIVVDCTENIGKCQQGFMLPRNCLRFWGSEYNCDSIRT